MTPPLSKLKVLDLTQVMASPFCCQVLADMGADVTKVEPPETGDQARHAMGFRMKGEDTAAAFIAVNRNKKSITLNLKEEEGRKIFYRLAQSSDVLVENYRPGVARRLGVDYEMLKEINPRLITRASRALGRPDLTPTARATT
jgi:crotonobetainyl-CoA:carnitine CoA-transferase CaiB-like acyl-CoA transferase